MTTTIAGSLVVAVPLAGLLWLSGAVAMHLALGTMLLVVFVVMSAGRLLLRAADAADMPAAAAWVLGIFATAIVLSALVAMFQLLAATAFALYGFMVLVLGIVFPERGKPTDRHHLLGLLLCAGATVFWCHELAAVPRIFANEGLLTTWTDQFIHGTVISQFGDPRAAGLDAIELVGLPPPLYHYASYMLPAAFAWPLDLPGLTLATSVWAPLAFFTLCAAVYTLGNALAGPASGVAALAMLTLLPDAASYGLHNRLFGYYWYVLAVPGASYGVAVALLSIAFLHRWSQARDLRALLVSVCLVGGLPAIRLNVFVLAFPAWLASAALSLRLVQGRKLAFLGLAGAAFALFVWAFYALVPDAAPALEPFLDVAHNQQQPVAYRGLYQGLMEFYGRGVALPVGVLLVFPACLGVLTILYPISVLLAYRSRGLRVIDWVPALHIICYLLLMITAPVPPNGDSTELTQRPFVMVYAVVAVWTAAGFVSWLALQGGIRARRVWLPLLVAAALSVVWILKGTVRDWRWAYSYQAAEGLPQAAGFMRSNWRSGDVLSVQGLKRGLITTDLAIQLVSLTGIPAYLTRPFLFLHVSRGEGRAEAAMQRYAALEAVAGEGSAEAALARLRALGIRWYVVAESDRRGPRWDPERRHAVFVDRMVAVYATR